MAAGERDPKRVRLLRDSERLVEEALDPDCGFRDLCHHVGLDPRTVARVLQLLELAGHVVVESESAKGEGTSFNAADDDVVREAVGLHAKLILELGLCRPLRSTAQRPLRSIGT